MKKYGMLIMRFFTSFGKKTKQTYIVQKHKAKQW